MDQSPAVRLLPLLAILLAPHPRCACLSASWVFVLHFVHAAPGSARPRSQRGCHLPMPQCGAAVADLDRLAVCRLPGLHPDGYILFFLASGPAGRVAVHDRERLCVYEAAAPAGRAVAGKGSRAVRAVRAAHALQCCPPAACRGQLQDAQPCHAAYAGWGLRFTSGCCSLSLALQGRPFQRGSNTSFAGVPHGEGKRYPTNSARSPACPARAASLPRPPTACRLPTRPGATPSTTSTPRPSLRRVSKFIRL